MANDDVLEIRIRIAAQPATVFKYFSDPSRFSKWMGDGSSIASVKSGAITVRYPNGDVAVGSVYEVVANELICFTWGYQNAANGLPPGASRVVVEFEAIETGTLVTLTQWGLNTEQRRSHAAGWRYYLGVLAVTASGEQLDGIVAPRVGDYLAAWGETDPVERLVLLERCWHSDAVFRDAMGVAEGRAGLSEYIANAQRIAPNMRLEQTGDMHRVHGHVYYSWRIASPNGGHAMTGQNFCEFAADGRLKSVVGFWDGAPAVLSR